MAATAGLISMVVTSVAALGRLEQQRVQKHTLEMLLESSPEENTAFKPSESSTQPSSGGTGRTAATLNSLPEPEPSNLPLGAPENPVVRVALLSQSPPRTVALTGEVNCTINNGNVINTTDLQNILAGDRNHLITCKSGPNGAVVVNQRPYPETMLFINRGAGWMAINQVSLESYVASVVGAEMPSHWNPEALKAQAVAARSAALVHLVRPADSDFNLGDTTRWQVYAGLKSQNISTKTAAKTTKGLVLSFKGGLVESLYASTSEIAAEAHSHLGASMSQHGAQRLAAKGLKFDEILGRYYIGAALAKLKSNEL